MTIRTDKSYIMCLVNVTIYYNIGKNYYELEM